MTDYKKLKALSNYCDMSFAELFAILACERNFPLMEEHQRLGKIRRALGVPIRQYAETPCLTREACISKIGLH